MTPEVEIWIYKPTITYQEVLDILVQLHPDVLLYESMNN